jgi:tRNA pseudouridine38-40 synthase
LRKIKLIVAYDGTDFWGWEKQASGRTVQGEIEAALAKIHKRPVPLTGSGRTDSGVHAAGQVAHFSTDIASLSAPRFIRALNSLLPQDVRVVDASEAPPDFHARFDARSRTYRYFVTAGRRAAPWELRYSWQIWRQPDWDRLSSYARLFRGEFDCTVFASPRDKSLSRSRYLYRAQFYPEGEKIVFEISANAFLWRMVRSIVGSLFFYEEKGFSCERVAGIIASGDRSLAGPTAPPQGLFLWKVDYY